MADENRQIDNAEHCVCCGQVIPEGSQYCIVCGYGIVNTSQSEVHNKRQ